MSLAISDIQVARETLPCVSDVFQRLIFAVFVAVAECLICEDNRSHIKKQRWTKPCRNEHLAMTLR